MDSLKECTGRRKKRKTKRELKFLSEELIPSYFKSYSVERRANYHKRFCELCPLKVIDHIFITVNRKLLSLIYIRGELISKDLKTIDNQISIIENLERLKRQDCNTDVNFNDFLDSDKYPYMALYRYKVYFNDIFYYLNSEGNYDQNQIITPRVTKLLSFRIKNLSGAQTRDHLRCVSEITKDCITVLISDFREHFNRIFPSHPEVSNSYEMMGSAMPVTGDTDTRRESKKVRFDLPDSNGLKAIDDGPDSGESDRQGFSFTGD